MTEQEKIAHFIANKGVTKIKRGESNNITNNEWYEADRNATTIEAVREQALIDDIKYKVA